MHRDTFCLRLLTNNSRLIGNLTPWQNPFISEITLKFGYSAKFSNLRFLFSKTQFTSDITSNVRFLDGTNRSTFFEFPPPP